MQKKVAENCCHVEQMRTERVNLAKENNFIRQLLSATEDVAVEPLSGLSGVCQENTGVLRLNVSGHRPKD